MKCPTCGAPMRDFNRILLLVAAVMTFALAMGMTRMGFWIFLSPIVGLTAIYFLVWATLGKGLWCRTCKTFPHPWMAPK